MIGARVRQDFNQDMLHTAGAPDSPKFPKSKKFEGAYEPVRGDIEKEILKNAQKHDCLFIYAYTFSSETLLTDLIDLGIPVSAIIQKPKRIVSSYITDLYSQLYMSVDRAHFPGTRLKHLFPKPGVKDYGQIDGFRWIGNVYASEDLRKEDDYPEMHDKVIIFCDFDKKGIPRAKAVMEGSYNLTKNSSRSCNHMTLHHSPVYANHCLEVWAHYYSWSEGLWNMRHGLFSEFFYLKGKTVKAAPVIECTECGDTNTVYSPIGPDQYGIRCLNPDCKHTMTMQMAGLEKE